MDVKEIFEKFDKNDSYNKAWEVLDSCEIYHQTEDGMNAVYDAWEEAKTTPVWNGKSVLEILSQHPNYVPEKGYVVFSSKYTRPLNFSVINYVLNEMIDYSETIMLKEFVIPPYSWREIRAIKESLAEAIDIFDHYRYGKYITINGHNRTYFRSEYRRFDDLEDKYYKENIDFLNRTPYLKTDLERRSQFIEAIRYIKNWCGVHKEDTALLVDESASADIERITGLRIHLGTKMNKVIQRICREYGIDKSDRYNSWTGRLGDAISPIQYTRHTIISANWIDYWTMSFGDNWCSCANIDKEHIRYSSQEGMYGDGCCSSGTESYMLDPSTVVMYTVDEKYDGKDFELQDKKNRCLFHIGEAKFVMGRIYPQGTDGEEATYKEWREKFQHFLATCMGVPNYWRTEKEQDLKNQQIESRGTHYQDYYMSYCKVAGWSYNKPTPDATYNPVKIKIGHNPICPCCGNTHDRQETIECEDCYEDRKILGTCAHCGSAIYEGDEYIRCYDNDEYYCDAYCANDEYVYYCEDGYWHDEDNWFQDDWDNYYYSIDDLAVSTENGFHFVSRQNAFDAGFDEDEDGRWYPNDEFMEDDETGEWFHIDDDTINIDVLWFRNEENARAYGFIQDDNGCWVTEDEESEVIA